MPAPGLGRGHVSVNVPVSRARFHDREKALEPARASKRKEVRVGEEARIDNVLTWLDGR